MRNKCLIILPVSYPGRIRHKISYYEFIITENGGQWNPSTQEAEEGGHSVSSRSTSLYNETVSWNI